MSNVLGNLVSGTECLEHTLIFIRSQSVTRTFGNVNYKAYSLQLVEFHSIPSLSLGIEWNLQLFEWEFLGIYLSGIHRKFE